MKKKTQKFKLLLNLITTKKYYKIFTDKQVRSIKWVTDNGSTHFGSNIRSHSARLVVADIHEASNYGVYKCIVELGRNQYVTKEVVLREDGVFQKLGPNHFEPVKTSRNAHDIKQPLRNAKRNKPEAKIIVVEEDIRDGGKVELKCANNWARDDSDDTVKWVKKHKSSYIELTSSDLFQINYLQPEDSGFYVCIVSNELGSSKTSYSIVIEHAKLNASSNHSIVFNFIESDIRPLGHLDIICENSVFGSALNKWIKIDPKKNSKSIIDGDRLTIMRLNKYDLDNFECVSEFNSLTVHRHLELDADLYSRELKRFFNSRNLKIHLVEDLTDVKAGKVTLKCTDEGEYIYI